MTQFKGVLFDKDGTLLDVMQTWFPVYQEILSEFHPGDDERVMKSLVAGGYDSETHNFKEGSMLAAGTPDQMVDIWWPELDGAERAERIIEADRLCTEKGLRHAREILPLKPYFKTLRTSGYHVGIATNDNTQSAVQQMEKLGVLDLIDVTIGFDAVEKFKLFTQESDVKAAGAGATDMHTQLSKKNTLQLGKWSRKNVSLILFDLTHVNTALTAHDATPVDGIIGADVLKRGKAVIDYEKKCLYLK